jgi:hypothetical protein
MVSLRYLGVWLFAMGILAVADRPAHAMPLFARQYGVTCRTCHSIPPRLNTFGLGFKANNFNWPDGSSPPRTSGLKSLPVSAVAEISTEDNRTAGERSTQFRALELLFAGGFRNGTRRGGGYMASVVAATTDEEEKTGNIEKLFVALPIAGQRGQWTLAAGQCSAVMYQCDHNQLVHEPPFALGGEFDTFSFAEPQPGVRVDYFDRRGQGSADGRYLAMGVPFEGRLALNRASFLRGPRGVFVHAFERRDQNTVGAFAYTHAGSHLGGVIATHELWKNFYLLGVGAIGEDVGNTRRLSLEGEYVASPRLALTARIDTAGGESNDAGQVVAITVYPLKQPVLRLTLETMQRKGDRSLALIARGQF